MNLPEPVRHAWRQHRNTLHRIAEYGSGGRLLIGGGTILAARWGHRLSEDIDVLLPDRDAVRDTHPGKRNDLAKATGGTVQGSWKDRIRVRVKHGLLDVRATRPELRGLEKNASIEDETVTVLRTAQILRGKLKRSHQGLARDAFDLIAAAKADPKALQHAVNALDKSETDVVRANLEDANDDIADIAEDALMGTGREFERDTSRLGLDAAQAVDNSRYERVRIALDGDKLTIERWAAKRKERPETHTADQVANALLESGIGEYLKANHELHETMAGQGIAELQRQRRQGPIFDSASRTRPAARIEEAAEAAMKREEKALAERKPARAGGDPGIEAPASRPAPMGNHGASNGPTRNTGNDGYQR